MFQKFPALKLVLIESGFTWLPTLLWRTNKTWRGVRPEVPWIDRPPAEILREHVRLTLQPLDAPTGRSATVRARAGPYRLRPHAAVLDRLSALAFRRRGRAAGRAARTIPCRRFMIDNPLETYPRLRDGTVADHVVLRDNAAASQEHVR